MRRRGLAAPIIEAALVKSIKHNVNRHYPMMKSTALLKVLADTNRVEETAIRIVTILLILSSPLLWTKTAKLRHVGHY